MPDCLNSWVFYLTNFKTSIIESPDNRSLTELGYLITLLNTAYTARRSNLMYSSNRKKSFFRGTELYTRILYLLNDLSEYLTEDDQYLPKPPENDPNQLKLDFEGTI